MHMQLVACQFITLPPWHGVVKPILGRHQCWSSTLAEYRHRRDWHRVPDRYCSILCSSRADSIPARLCTQVRQRGLSPARLVQPGFEPAGPVAADSEPGPVSQDAGMCRHRASGVALRRLHLRVIRWYALAGDDCHGVGLQLGLCRTGHFCHRCGYQACQDRRVDHRDGPILVGGFGPTLGNGNSIPWPGNDCGTALWNDCKCRCLDVSMP